MMKIIGFERIKVDMVSGGTNVTLKCIKCNEIMTVFVKMLTYPSVKCNKCGNHGNFQSQG